MPGEGNPQPPDNPRIALPDQRISSLLQDTFLPWEQRRLQNLRRLTPTAIQSNIKPQLEQLPSLHKDSIPMAIVAYFNSPLGFMNGIMLRQKNATRKGNSEEVLLWKDVYSGVRNMAENVERTIAYSRGNRSEIEKEITDLASQLNWLHTPKDRRDFVFASMETVRWYASLLSYDPTGLQTVTTIIKRLKASAEERPVPKQDCIQEFFLAGVDLFGKQYEIIAKALPSELPSPDFHY